MSFWRKGMGLLAVAYAVSPIDAIPDFIPILGWLDDLGVVGAVTWFFVREVKKHRASSTSHGAPPDRPGTP